MIGGTRFAAGALIVAGALAGCGGESEPTAVEKRAAASKWIQHVDAACSKANDAIGERGWAADLVDLDRLVVRGVDDVREAIRAIAAIPLPQDDGPRHADFVRELKELEPHLEQLSEASEGLEPAALIEAADALTPQLTAVEKAGKEAGLRECLQHDERFFVPDAVRAPVFAEQFARLDRRLLRKLEGIDQTVGTPGEVARNLDRASGLLKQSIEGIDRLDPPHWAADQVGAYQRALRDGLALLDRLASMFAADRGKPQDEIDWRAYDRVSRDIQRAGRVERRTYKRMLRAVGAAPTTGPGHDEDEAPEADDEQVS